MKKNATIIIPSLILSILVGCSNTETSHAPVKKPSTTVTEETPKVEDVSSTQQSQTEEVNHKQPDSESKPVSQTEIKNYRIFYYDGNAEKFYYKDEEVEVKEKAVVSALTNAMKTPPQDTLLSLDSEVKVKSAKVEGDTLKVDLSDDYYKLLTKVGASSEDGMLKSLAYTYGYNYHVSKVVITINGKPYEGGHIALADGEYISVNANGIEALK